MKFCDIDLSIGMKEDIPREPSKKKSPLEELADRIDQLEITLNKVLSFEDFYRVIHRLSI